MKKIVLIVLLALGAAWFGGRALVQQFMPAAEAAALDAEHARIADAFLDHLDAGRYDDALAMLDTDAREALAGGKLQEVWAALSAQLGARKSRSALRGESVDGTPVATSTLAFAMLSLDARIAVDADGHISGFRLVPAAAGSAPAAPVETAAFVETEVMLGDGARALPATLTRPRAGAPVAAVVFVHGSGPHDRDETIGPNKPFRDLAHGLAERGIASLRYEKRTKARPEDFASGDFDVDDEVVDDAAAAVRQLRATDGIDPARVFVAGHSLGALMAPRIAQRAPEAAGLVLLAAPARPIADIYIEQIEFLAAGDGGVSDDERAKLDIERAKAAAIATLTPDAPAADNLLGLPARFWIDLRDYDPVAVAGTLPQPMLVLQGARDYQVTPTGDFARWKAAFTGDARVTLREFPGLNHLFIAGTGAPNPQEYLVEGHVDAGVIDAVADWIASVQGCDTAASSP